MCRIVVSILFAFTLFSIAPERAAAQAAVNVASFANPNLPNGSLAQGGMFTVFGSGLGPASLMQAGAFPLPTTLAGTSIKATVGGTTVDCIMIFTSAGQVAGILPSNTPVGQGTMQVTYNGVATAPFAITVVAHSFGTFGINSAGSGPGVLTNAITGAVNTIANSARPGELWDIWGTGLGAAPFPDNQLPLPAVDLRQGYQVQVVVGGQQTQAAYAGRSGCCSGVDQIRFTVPQNLSGCYVPLYLVVGGVPSNFTSISIAPGGGACADPGGLSAAGLSDGSLTIGLISLSKLTIDFDLSGFSGVGQTIPTSFSTEFAGASYSSYNRDQAIRQSFDGALYTRGACTVYQFLGDEGDFSDPIEPAGLDAGPQTTITGPSGARTMTRDAVGEYFVSLSTPGFPFAAQRSLVKRLGVQAIRAAAGGVEQGVIQPFFTTGLYTYAAPGGSHVGAHSKSITLGEGLDWTNKEEIAEVVRDQGQRLTWMPFSGDAWIFGSSYMSLTDDETVGAGFFCLANGSTGSFTVPAAILQLLPPSETTVEDGVSFESGALAIGQTLREECEASGLDVCSLGYTDLQLKQMGYR